MKVYLDNNFITKYEASKDESYKKALKDAFAYHKFSCYISYELLSESVGIARSGIGQKLIERLSLISDILSGRVFNSYGKIIRTELGLINENLFVPTTHIRKRLQDISNGLVGQNRIDILLDDDERQKKEHFEYYKKQQALIRKSDKKRQKNKISFEKFKEKNKNHMLDFIRNILKESHDSQIDYHISHIAKDIIKYKYFNTYFNTIMGLHYKYFEEDYKVKASDFFDALHLVYLTDLDAFFTDDKKLRWLCNIVFSRTKKIISFEEIKDYL